MEANEKMMCWFLGMIHWELALANDALTRDMKSDVKQFIAEEREDTGRKLMKALDIEEEKMVEMFKKAQQPLYGIHR